MICTDYSMIYTEKRELYRQQYNFMKATVASMIYIVINIIYSQQYDLCAHQHEPNRHEYDLYVHTSVWHLPSPVRFKQKT